MKYALGIDFGGGSSKATLIDENGNIVATASEEYETVSTVDGGREQDPDAWVKAAVDNIKKATTGVKVDPRDVVSLCFDAATHTAVLMDENFRLVRPSVYWTDTRSVAEKEYLKREYGEEIFNKFKHEVDTIWTLPELLWVKNKEPENFAKVNKICFAKDYVRRFFTDDFVTDDIEAEGSMLFDFDRRQWDKKFLSILGLSEENLPEVVRPDKIAGYVTEKAAAATGLKVGTPVICGTTDTAMEVFAAGAVEKGQATLKLATAGRICVVSDKLIPDKNLINYSHVISGLYYPGTATKSCAASLRWFRDTFGGDYAGFGTEAAKIPVGCEGLIFHPYLSGELTPYGNPKLKGSFVGISSTHTKAHFARAVMEGVAMSLLDCKSYLETRGVKPTSAFALGGGAKSDVWRQIVADALDIELITTEDNDSSFGSAMFAGINAGFFKDEKDALIKCRKVTGKTAPIAENTVKYAEMFKKYKKIQQVLQEIYND